jgi:hypothetical protein
MLGAGRGVSLPNGSEPLSLGRLLKLAVPDAAFRPYEPAFVERLLQGRVAKAGPVMSASQR